MRVNEKKHNQETVINLDITPSSLRTTAALARIGAEVHKCLRAHERCRGNSRLKKFHGVVKKRALAVGVWNHCASIDPGNTRDKRETIKKGITS